EVHEATGEPVDEPGSEVEIEIHGEGGLYVKELVSGDEGRTEPNLADELGDGVEAEVKKLDVLEVEGDFLKDEFVKNGE
ncbi:MAG: tRNA pseudouridine(54/55) synthase Pus10, partial [Halobacteria archaeon]|nr:tRNA pseudouridine(54/55) synthase Pus10 [Halobacteria archaeon]